MDRNVAHLAVCNLLAGRYDLLPPIHVGCFSLCSDVNSGDHERSGCAILTGEDCRSNDNDDNQPPSGNLPFFKVIILTASFYDLKFDLHAFSSRRFEYAA
ncbi:hypothetical protein ZWY2020_022866 [Hordeum vulgare]|nr:hypothetical protein ZWY2020_022866 [Hordeum vulgare]